MLKDLKKLLTSNKNVKFDKNYVKIMTNADERLMQLFSFYSSYIQGLQNSFCDLCTLYNKVFEEVISNITKPSIVDVEDIISPDNQQYIANVIKEIFKSQVFNPLYSNVCSAEEQIEELKEADSFLTESLKKMVSNVRFNMEEFEMFLNDKPFGLIDVEITTENE